MAENYGKFDSREVIDKNTARKISDKSFFSEFLESPRVWLITWNKDNWKWEYFEEKCAATKAGRTFVEGWSCSNSNPKLGEEVFLIKLGQHPRGIIGHGTVIKTSYETEHYDPVKAAEGKREKCIDVKFDRLIDYEKEPFVNQKDLIEKCPGQHWSPQNSGIEVKQEVVPMLHELWKETVNDEWWPSLSEYDPGITAEQYETILRKGYTGYVNTLSTLYYLYKMGGSGSCSEVAERFGGTPKAYVGFANGVARYVASESKCPLQKRDGTNADLKWPVLFYGKEQSAEKKGVFQWKLREPLTDAIRSMEADGFFRELVRAEQKMLNDFDHNIILYGPPGTGKTYNSVIYAVSICDNRIVEEVEKEPYEDTLKRYNYLEESGRIAFTTFHQSYGYEEFIEGIKPRLNAETGSIGYTIEDGVFKKFCKRAKAVKVQSGALPKMKEQPRIWGMLLGGTGMNDIKRACFDLGEIRLGFDETSDAEIEELLEKNDTPITGFKRIIADFMSSMEVGDLVVIEKSNKSIDAIGLITGDYEFDVNLRRYPRKRKVEWLVKDIDRDIVQFLPAGRQQMSRYSVFAFDYLGMDAISQILSENSYAPILEVEREKKPHVFIIDEINRGNISKVFGELITLIEDTKRAGAPEAMEATLPYSGESFSVPNNVYILGTMNTADRSIALMDTALRRRFKFVEMMPKSEVLESLGVGTIIINGKELNVSKMLDIINKRIEFLFDREHTIGHAFFTKLAEDPSIETLASIFEKNVIPLLQEYFYEDYEKIQLVLGDNSKPDEYKFIADSPVKIKDIFKGNPDIDLPEKGYHVQKEAFRKLESYKQIGEGL